MNATPTNILPGNAVQVQAQSGKAADASANDTPFSQVLSGEIARTGQPAEDHADASSPAASVRPAHPRSVGTAPDQASAAGDTADAIVLQLTDARDAAALALDAGSTPDALPDTLSDALAGEDSATGESAAPPAATDTPASPTDMLLALPVVPPELAKPTLPAATATAARAGTVQAEGRAIAPDAPDTRGRRPAQKLDHQVAQADATAPKRVPAAAVQANGTEAAAAKAAAPAFSEQLATVRQIDPSRAAERAAELMNHPGMRAVAHAAASEAVPTAADPASGRLAPAVGTPAWGQALGDKIVWMANGAQQSATLTLNPPDLGPLQVTLDVKNDQATASFYAAQPEVRQALEAALPRLRDMMTDAGIQLGQATVSADTSRQNDTPDRQAPRIAPELAGGDAGGVNVSPAVPLGAVRSGRGLVDTFA